MSRTGYNAEVKNAKRAILKEIEKKDAAEIVAVFKTYKPQKNSTAQSAIYEILLELPREKFDALFEDHKNRIGLKILLPNHNTWNIRRYYNRLHAVTDKRVQMTRYETDEGHLFQIQFEGKKGNKKTVNFTRNYSLGSERVLSADPISMSAEEWKMFADRGHGLYATSIITRVIGTLGIYIAEVERAYDLQPIKDSVTGQYFLSENDMAILKERDPNAFAKYQVIRTAQEELRKLYQSEREVDPKHVKAQRDFKHGVNKIIGELSGALYQQKQADIDHMPMTSDHILAYAKEQVNHFEWPNDSKGTRFKITEADQLIAKPGERVMYDPSKEPSSAAGASVFRKTLSGFGEMGFRNFAHCLTVMDDFNRTQRTAFLQAVQKLKPSEGLRLEATSTKDRAREMESKRMALSILKEVSETDEKVKDVFQKSIEFFDTKTGHDLCEREFGCGSEVFKAHILYEMVVHAADTLSLNTRELLEAEGRKYLHQISEEKDKSKPDKRKISVLESVVIKMDDLENKALEKRSERSKESDKINSMFKTVQKELGRLEKDQWDETKNHAQVDELIKGDYKTKKTSELRDIHAELIGRYGSGASTVDELRKRLNQFLDKYSEGFCVEVLGTSKSDFIELVMQNALKRVEPEQLNNLDAFYKKKGGWFLDLIENEKKENQHAENKSVRDVSDRIISRKPDPLLEAKAKEIAEQALIKENPIDFIQKAAKERMPHQEKRLIASVLYRYALKCDDSQFEKIKNELSSLISPYHDVSNIAEIRGLLADVQNAKTNRDQAALDQAMQKLNPRILNPDRQTGDVFLRMGLMGFTYKLINPIAGVLEEIGAYDPIRGTLALGVMGLGIGYVMAVHGAAVAASAAHSHFVSALTKTYVIPEVYKNVMVLTPHVGTGKTVAAGLVDGITLGKAFYLLSSASDMAVSGGSSGFTGKVIAGIMNNPIETMVLVTLMTAVGQGMVIGLHEQAAMGGGGWRLMAGFFEALKAADVGYHGVLEVMKIVSDDAARSPEGLQHPEDIKALYAGMLAQKLFSAMTPEEQKQFPLADLKEKFDNAFEKINIKNVGEFNRLTEHFLKEFDEKERSVIENKLNAPAAALALSQQQNTVIDAIKTKFEITEENPLAKLSTDDQIRYGLCVQQGLELLAKDPALSAKEIAESVANQFPNMEPVSLDYLPLYQKMRGSYQIAEKTVGHVDAYSKFSNISSINFLKELYPDESTAYSHGVDLKNESKDLEIHQKHKQDYLAQLFTRELLTEKSKDSDIWKAVFNDPKLQAQVEKIAGVSWATLRDQEVPKFRTLGEKIADVAKAALPSATANVEGFGKFMNLVLRLPAKIGGVVGTAAIRAATMFAMVAKPGLGRAEANYNRAGQETARVVTGTIGKYTTARPDGVSQWRRSFSSPQLGGKAKPLGNENLYFRLINWVNPIMENRGNDFFNKLGQQLKKPYSKGSQEEQLVDLLKPLFPFEVKTLEKKLADQQIPEKEKNSYMLAALQELCHDEMMMCSKEERAALENNPSLVQMIAGQSIHSAKTDDDVVTATSKKVQEAIQQACDTIFYTATATREDVLGKQAIPAYRLSSNKIGDLFSNIENKPTVEVSKSLLTEKLQEIVNEYTKTKSVLGFDSHLIKSLRVALKTMPENADGNKAALHVLSTLFPVEFRQIEQKMMAQGTPDNQRESVKLHVLQAIMKNELDAAATKSKTAFAAYSTVLDQGDRGLCQLLTGKERVGFISESHHLPSVIVSQQPVASNKPAEDSVSKPSPKPHSP